MTYQDLTHPSIILVFMAAICLLKALYHGIKAERYDGLDILLAIKEYNISKFSAGIALLLLILSLIFSRY